MRLMLCTIVYNDDGRLEQTRSRKARPRPADTATFVSLQGYRSAYVEGHTAQRAHFKEDPVEQDQSPSFNASLFQTTQYR